MSQTNRTARWRRLSSSAGTSSREDQPGQDSLRRDLQHVRCWMLAWRGLRRTTSQDEQPSVLGALVAHLNGSLVMLRAVPINVVVRSDGLLQFVADDHTRTLCGGSASKYHYTRPGVRESRLGGGISDCKGRTLNHLLPVARQQLTRQRQCNAAAACQRQLAMGPGRGFPGYR